MSREESTGLCCFYVLWYIKSDRIWTQNVGMGDALSTSWGLGAGAGGGTCAVLADSKMLSFSSVTAPLLTAFHASRSWASTQPVLRDCRPRTSTT